MSAGRSPTSRRKTSSGLDDVGGRLQRQATRRARQWRPHSKRPARQSQPANAFEGTMTASGGRRRLVGRDDVAVVVTAGGLGVAPTELTLEAVHPLSRKPCRDSRKCTGAPLRTPGDRSVATGDEPRAPMGRRSRPRTRRRPVSPLTRSRGGSPVTRRRTVLTHSRRIHGISLVSVYPT